MKLNLLAFAVPLFVVFMVLEYLVARKKKLPYFNLNNSIANVSIGIAERLLDVFVTGLFFFIYDYLQKHYGIFNIRSGVLLWLLLLIATDFLWYWYHRFAHEINIFWAVHVVHHQSEDFNYTVSARITVFQAIVRTGFWAVLSVIGFPASMITSVLLVHGLYPFFIHTRLIGKLGILEYILVTPSHHRVHHASNEKYLDKNYGDVFIIWDKLFGTFQKEEDDIRIEYGLTQPLKSYSFLWQHFHFVIELIFAARQVKGFYNKWKVFFGKPDDLDPNLRTEAEKVFLPRKPDVSPDNQPLNRYVVWQVVLTLPLLFIFILLEQRIPVIQQVLIALTILLTLINCGAIMEQKQWVFSLEFLRLLTVGISFVLTYPYTWLLVSILIVAGVLARYFQTARSYYLQWIYTGNDV